MMTIFSFHRSYDHPAGRAVTTNDPEAPTACAPSVSSGGKQWGTNYR